MARVKINPGQQEFGGFAVWRDGMNPEQLQVVEHVNGPLVVQAVAGSGKSRSMVNRIACLVREHHVPGESICAVTFSVKAASVLNTRLSKIHKITSARIGTWHSLALQIMREDRTVKEHGDFDQWTVDDRDRAKFIVKKVLGHEYLDWKKADLRKVRAFIGICKANLWTWENPEAMELAQRTFGVHFRLALDAFSVSQSLIERDRWLTFDDYLVFAARHLADEGNRQRWAQRWDYLVCDEFQDNSGAQNVIAEALVRDHRNYCVVGDVAQCIPAGQMISTPKGLKPIEQIREGDEVFAVKAGLAVVRRVLKKSKTKKTRAFEYDLGEHGSFQATREHILFAAIDDPKGSFVYLMYRPDLGFRIGVSRTVGYKGKHFIVRTQQETAERLWVLAWFEKYDDAAEQEAYWAYEFGVPREPFAPREGMWSGNANATCNLFVRFGRNGQKLLDALGLDFERPNYFAKAKAGRRGRIAVNLILATKDGHRVEVETSLADPKKCRSLGMLPTTKGTMRIRKCSQQLRESREFAERIVKTLGGYIVESFSGAAANRRMLAVPAVSVHPGMFVPFVRDGVLISVPVIGRREVDVSDCYDMEVDGAANFIVNDVVVHNSLYSFRGASPHFMIDFEKQWNAKRIAMVRNYRCGRRIVEVANAVIGPAILRMPEEMVAERATEGEVRAISFADYDDEGRAVAQWAQRHQAGGGSLSDFVILYRMNVQSRAVEEALLKAKLPYLIVGGKGFYERKEVKDLLGYLRVVAGREGFGDDDGDAIRRCINAPFRYLGKAFVGRVMDLASDGRTDWVRVVREVSEQTGLQYRQRASASEWADIIERAAAMATKTQRRDPRTDVTVEREESPADILTWIVDRTGYIAAVEKEEGEESIETSGGANVREMIRVSRAFATTTDLLDYVDAMIKAAAKQRRDQQAGGERLLLMSVHASKGLEFPSVWVIGCNEGILPHSKGDLEEERRIAYVAVTRAKDALTLSYVQNYVTRVGIREAEPSRFLLDAKLVRNPELDEAEAEVLLGEEASS